MRLDGTVADKFVVVGIQPRITQALLRCAACKRISDIKIIEEFRVQLFDARSRVGRHIVCLNAHTLR